MGCKSSVLASQTLTVPSQLEEASHRPSELKFTPDLRFVHDESFDEAARMTRLFQDPRVARDLVPPPPSPSGRGDIDKEEPGRRPGGDGWKDED